MPLALTDASIADCVTGMASPLRRELVDERETGLRLRIGPKDAVWSVSTLGPGGQRIRVSLGGWPQLDVSAARSYARALKASLRPAPVSEAAALTVGQLLDIYARRRLSQLRKAKVIERSIRAALHDVADLDPVAVTRRHIAEAVDVIADRAPIHANRTLAYLKAFFVWCLGRGYIERNPAEGIAKPTRERSRERTPSLAEVVEIWEAAGKLGYPFGPIVRLLVLTAARRDEVGAMRPEEIVADGDARVWTLPAARSKNGRAIRVPLSTLATTIIEEALTDRPDDMTFLFTTLGDRPVSGWSRAKRRLDAYINARRVKEKRGPMEPWRFHDLRRAFATQACDHLGIDPAIADRCLNHVGASTTSTVARVYGRSELFEQRRDALIRWAALVEAAVASAKKG